MSPRYSYVITSIRELIIQYGSNNFMIIIFNPYKELQGDPKVSIGEKIIKKCINPYAYITQCHLRNPQVECYNIHQVNQYDTPLSPQVLIPQDIHHVFSDLKIQSDKTKLQRFKIQFITARIERGETSYDPSTLTNPMIHQDRDISRSRERERERD